MLHLAIDHRRRGRGVVYLVAGGTVVNWMETKRSAAMRSSLRARVHCPWNIRRAIAPIQASFCRGIDKFGRLAALVYCRKRLGPNPYPWWDPTGVTDFLLPHPKGNYPADTGTLGGEGLETIGRWGALMSQLADKAFEQSMSPVNLNSCDATWKANRFFKCHESDINYIPKFSF